MNRGAISYIIRIFTQRILGVLFYLLGAWWSMSVRSWAYFSVHFAAAIISSIVMFRVNPATLSERGKTNTDSPIWDKWLLGVFWLLAFFLIYFIAGLESSKAPPPGTLFWIGILLQLPVLALALHALAVNTFLESTARVQADRNQTVCTSGPYRVIRHPTYTSVLLWCVSVSMVFETPFVIVTAAVIAVIIVIRTYLEDRMLKQRLAGYAQYARKVRYRLIPFIW